MSAKDAAVWLDLVSESIAKMKQPNRPKVFIYDKPIPPRYATWKQSRRVPKTL
jgi:hypothetical protein